MKPRRRTLAKLTPPTLPLVLNRPRLFQLLDKSRARSLTWITAPPGAGKTTLVASYLRSRRLPVCWYRLDESDADPSSFFHYLTVAAKVLAPRFRKPLPILTPEYALGLPTFTRRYVRDLSIRLPRRCVLVLDNYQELPATTALHHLLCCAVEELPRHVSVIVMSRQHPPDAMAKLKIDREMTLVGPEKVELSKAEAGAIVRLHTRQKAGRSVKALVDELFRRVGGWAAGLVLTLEHADTKDITTPAQAGETPEAVFHYLAGEVMEHLAPEVQSLLLKTSVLTDISVPMAQRLTNSSTAGEILSSLHAGRYFTERLQGPELWYRYHPLFRDFLLRQARQVMGPTEFRALQRVAAGLLVHAGRIEDGVALLQAAEDWEGLASVILAQANVLIADGRIQTLEGWIRSVPESIRNQIPWLSFWLATTRVAFNPDEAYGLFDDALGKFRAQGEEAGALLAWSGAVRAVLIRWADMGRLSKLLELFPTLHQEGTPYPSIEIEAHVADCIAGAIMQRQPYRTDARAWLDRAVLLSDHLPLSIQTGSRYMTEIYYLWFGDFAAARAGLERFYHLTKSRQWDPITTIFFHATNATFAWFNVEVDLCRMHVRTARDLANQSGIHILDALILSQGAASELLAENLPTAEALLREEDAATEQLGGIHRAHFLHIFSWFKLLRGDFQEAWKCIQHSLSLIATEGGLMFGEGSNGIVAAHVLRELGRGAEAARWIEQVMEIGDRMQSDLLRFGAWLLTAQLAFDRGDESAGLDAVEKGLAIGEARGMMQYPGMQRNVMASLCAKALEAGIRVPFVQRMIQRHRFIAPSEARHVEAWPWPVKISTLGRFAVLIDGQPLALKRKAPHRLFDLLKAIIARGGEDVSITQLMDAFWPDVDGDTARENFDKSLQRLRRLLCHEQVIVIKAGKVSLNREHCWVDILAFEDLGREIGHVGTHGDIEWATRLAERAQSLYGGPFLAEEDHVPWFESRRERVRAGCVQVVSLLCDHWVVKGLPDNAIACLKSVIAADRDMTPLVSARLERLRGQAQGLAQPPIQH